MTMIDESAQSHDLAEDRVPVPMDVTATDTDQNSPDAQLALEVSMSNGARSEAQEVPLVKNEEGAASEDVPTVAESLEPLKAEETAQPHELLPAASVQQDDFMASANDATRIAQTVLDTAPIAAMQLSHERAANALAGHQDALQAILNGDSTTRQDFQTLPDAPYQLDTRDESIAAPPAFEHAPPMSVSGDMTMTLEPSAIEEPVSAIQDLEGPQIRAFAKLEFDDGPFYMNTYSVELGRDVHAAKISARKDSKGQERRNRSSPGPKSSSAGEMPQTPIRHRREDSGRVGGSVISESGGIMGIDTSDREDALKKRRSRRGSRKSKSTTSDSQHLSRKNSSVVPNLQTDYQSLAMASLSHGGSRGAHPVDPLSLLPSPDECPLIPIHPPALTAETGGHKGISRKHVKIAFNFEKHLFELHINGRNGAFVEDRWHAAGEIIPLKNGSHIQIGGVGLKFALPDVRQGETGAEGVELNSGEQPGFGFAGDVDHDMAMEGDSEDLSDDVGLTSGSGDDEEDEDEEDEEEDEGEVALENGELMSDEVEEEEEEDEEEEVEATPPPVIIPVKRGPGRPPKNGIMSKRQQQQLAREAKLAAKKTVPPPVVEKNKPGRPRKNTRPETPPPKPEKRKYTKRKGLEGASPERVKKEKTADGGEQGPVEVKPPKEKKEKKPPRAPRSPSPVFDEATLTAEELSKPQSSYVVLIHEALTNSKTGAMSLPQIYRAIERRYPFYKLRVTTTGWQSSVRHNLSQHHAFQKVERDGKGWMWGIVPGVSIEKEKKRRASPPPQMSQQHLQQQGYPGRPPMPMSHPHMMPAPHGLANMGPPPPHTIASRPPPGAPFAKPPLPHHPLQAYPPAAPRPPSGYQSPYATSTPPNPQVSTIAASTPAPQAASAYSSPHHHQANYPNHPHPAAQSPNPHPTPNSRIPSNPYSQQPAHRPTSTTMTNPSNNRPPPQPSAASSSSNQSQPPPPRAGPALNAEIIQAVQNFKSALIKSLPRADTTNVSSEAIVQSAVNRALGLSDRTSLPNGIEHPKEITIMKALQSLIGGLTAKPAGGANGTSVHAQRQAQPRPPPPQQQHGGGGGGGPVQRPPLQGGGQQQQQQGSNNNATAQLLQFLQQAGRRGTSSASPARGQQQPHASPSNPSPSPASSAAVATNGHANTSSSLATPTPPPPATVGATSTANPASASKADVATAPAPAPAASPAPSASALAPAPSPSPGLSSAGETPTPPNGLANIAAAASAQLAGAKRSADSDGEGAARAAKRERVRSPSPAQSAGGVESNAVGEAVGV